MGAGLKYYYSFERKWILLTALRMLVLILLLNTIRVNINNDTSNLLDQGFFSDDD